MSDIRVDHLSFAYPGAPVRALDEIDLHIPEGQFVLLAGPSGCGKSTLALALAGLIPSRIGGRMRGTITLGGRNISTMDVHEVAQHVGMVFQNPDNQLVHLDVEAEVAFGPENLGIPQAEISRRVAQALTYTGMERWRGQQIFALSGGQKQRIAIAATIAMQPNVLILDEPTSDLDPVGTQEVLNVLRTLNKQHGMTIVLVEHKIDEVIPWVDRVMLMERGAVVRDTAPRAAFRDVGQWARLGVAVPQIVQLAHALPEVFSGVVPLSVDEAHAGLQTSRYARRFERGGFEQGTPQRLFGGESGALSWEAVGLRYDRNEVLKNLNLQIEPAEWVAVVGPNGSGKTSLASLAMGMQAPTSGIVRCWGTVVEAGNISRQAQRLAYLFQAADNMLFGSTVEQEFLFGMPRRGGYSPETTATLERLLAMTDLASKREANPFHLSHGQRKRLAIGALLMRQPNALILDEPTTGQDEGHAQAFLDFLQQLRANNRLTYMLITHDMRAAARYASRVVVVHRGEVALDGPPAVVFAHAEELARCSIVPPPMALLHNRLSGGRAQRVALNVAEFLRALQPSEVMV